MLMVAEPVEAEVTGWFAAANVLVTVHKLPGPDSTEFVRNLQFHMYPGGDGAPLC
jgi:hypothetical protein